MTLRQGWCCHILACLCVILAARSLQAGMAPDTLAMVEEYQQSSRFDEGKTALEEAINKAATSEERQELETALAHLHRVWGESLAKRYAYQEAIPHYEQAIALDREQRPVAAAATLGMLGNVYFDLSQYDTARSYYDQVLVLQREHADGAGEGVVLNRLGEVSLAVGKSEEALTLFEQALTILREVKDRRGEGRVLDNLGEASLELSRYEQGRAYLEQALRIAQEQQQQKEDEAETLRNLGAAARILSQHDVASQYLEQALRLSRTLQDRRGEARALNGLGMLHQRLSHYEQAIQLLEQALTISREVQDRETESACLGNLGNSYHFLSQNDRAREYYEQALSLIRAMNNRSGEGIILSNLGNTYLSLSQVDKAIEYFESSLAIAREVKNRNGEGRSLSKLGLAYFQLSQYQKAIADLEQALTIARETTDRELESTALNNLGLAHRGLGHYEQAMTYYEQALAIDREINNRDGEGRTLVSLGDAAIELSQYERAITYLEPAAVILREVKDRNGEAHALNNLGSAYNGMSRYEKAVEYWESALVILREVQYRFGEGRALNNLGLAYGNLGQHEKAIGYFEQSLAIRREVQDRVGEAAVLTNLGGAYFTLGQYQQASTYFEQGLMIAREVQDRSGEGTLLQNLGVVSSRLGQREKAVAYYEQSLALHRAVKNRAKEGATLSNLAMVHVDMGEQERGKTYLEQALAIAREVKNRDGESNVLSNLGSVQFSLEQYEQAIAYEETALALAREVKNPEREGRLLSNLMAAWQKRGNLSLATFYGKQAVNVYQGIRGNIRGLSTELQQSYLQDNAETYRVLADLLIAESRLPEAEQVLRFLKEEELYEFVRRDATAVDAVARVALTATEQDWVRRYLEIANQVSALGAESAALRAKKNPTDAEKTRLEVLDVDLQAVRLAFTTFLDTLKVALRESQTGGDEVVTATSAKSFQATLRQLEPGTVALYTVVGKEKLWVMLVTPEVYKAYETPIAAADLNRKILAFRQIVQNPTLDPRPLAQELYSLLLGPVEADLQIAGAQTLMWSLDGMLRYVPMAALYDGQQYVMERYRTTVFTLTGRDTLRELPSRAWRAAGLGVSKAQAGFAALTYVPEEIAAIVQSDAHHGVLPGTAALDEGFTPALFSSVLRESYPVIHIASHFQFQPGTETESFLLLGDGQRLSIAQLKGYDFANVELLTLSACNTAFGSEGDGKEVESFAMLAQEGGARAVLASLWPVADTSTKELMQLFYRGRESKKGMSKAEALRQAQLALLHGVGKKAGVDKARGVVRVEHDSPSMNEQNNTAPQFVKDPTAPYAHPYYWAPFILIGNWR